MVSAVRFDLDPNLLCRTCGCPLGNQQEVLSMIREDLARAATWVGRVSDSDIFVRDLIAQQLRMIDCYLAGTHCTREAAGHGVQR